MSNGNICGSNTITIISRITLQTLASTQIITTSPDITSRDSGVFKNAKTEAVHATYSLSSSRYLVTQKATTQT